MAPSAMRRAASAGVTSFDIVPYALPQASQNRRRKAVTTRHTSQRFRIRIVPTSYWNDPFSVN
jgi:hypothetical protein